MRLINIKSFLGREELMREKKPVDRRTKVLEFRDDETTDYAILSHRWIEQEVDYDEMTQLAKMEEEERDDIRQRDGYRKILDGCEQAKRDGYKWLWVDTCCINKESSAELSEAINSMYRWYQNSRICYAYLHDVPDSSFPASSNMTTYPDFNGFPEWFSRGWTLQEMIAPSNVQFFNKYWQPLGDKRSLAHALADITRVPQRILMDGLSSNRPCVAQIMSWAANRTTTRVEDRAYSLLGLLDVNMPMLYGEGTKAFHRLQLEIIRMSNDQSIFAWSFRGSGRTGSILADDPSFFRECFEMELMDPDEFIQSFELAIPEEELRSIEKDRLGVFPITNRGIQIWLPLRPLNVSRSVFKAWLPCRTHPSLPLVSITLALWKSNYYRYDTSLWEAFPTERTLQFHQVYLTYQGTPHRDTTFEIDDSAITENGLTYCGMYPSELTGNTHTLTSTDPFYIKVYIDSQADCHFAVGYGQCFGQDWIHFVFTEHVSTSNRRSWTDYAKEEYKKMLVRAPERAQSMAEVCSRGERDGRLCITRARLPRSTWTVRTSCVMWENSRRCGVRIEVFQYHGFNNISGEWKCSRVEGTDDPDCDMRGLMLCHRSSKWSGGRYMLLADGVSVEFTSTPDGAKLGDYGHFVNSKDFRCEGNVFADLKSLSLNADLTPRQYKILAKDEHEMTDWVLVHHGLNLSASDKFFYLYKPVGLSLPRHHHLNSLLADLSTRLTNKYLITRVVQDVSPRAPTCFISCVHCLIIGLVMDTNRPMIRTPLCTIEQPFVWHRDGGPGSASDPEIY
ncbi:heterokaryon incompatibility protein-domain-containing protein [Scleroderma yunnanense]